MNEPQIGIDPHHQESGDPTLEAQFDLAMRSAVSLAQAMYRRHYREKTPEWKVQPDLVGVISQIDNMSAGMGSMIESLRQELEEAREEVEQSDRIHADRICEIGMALDCDLPEHNPYADRQSIEFGIYQLRQSLATAERERDEASGCLAAITTDLQERVKSCEYCHGKGGKYYTSDPQGGMHDCQECEPFRELLKLITPNPGAALVERLEIAEQTSSALHKQLGEAMELHQKWWERCNEETARALSLEHSLDAALSRCRELEGIVKSASPLIAVMEFDHDPSRPLPRTDIEYRTQYHDRAADWLDSLKALSTPPQPEQKPQTVPVEVADEMAKQLQHVLDTTKQWNEDMVKVIGRVPNTGIPTAGPWMALERYRSARAIGGRVE